jgi:outer membrane lipoprotein-sorting protein
MRKTLLHIIVIFLASSFSLQAQLQEKDMQFLEQVSTHYADDYQMEVMVYAFPEGTAQARVLDSCFTARQQGNMIITTQNYDVLLSDDYKLTANHLNKEIIIVTKDKTNQQLASNQYEFNTEELEQSKALFSTRREGQSLLFEAEDLNIYSKITYHFDIKSYALTKVVYKYSDNVGSGAPKRIEIIYTNIKVNTDVSSSIFDLDRYVVQRNGTFIVNENFQAYQLNQNL